MLSPCAATVGRMCHPTAVEVSRMLLLGAAPKFAFGQRKGLLRAHALNR